MGNTTRLSERLRRCLQPWNPKTDGPFIEIGTLVEAFPMIPGTSWHGALADTRADGFRPAKRRGIKGRTLQHWRIGVLAENLTEWIAEQNPHLERDYIQRIVDDLVARERRRRTEAHAASAKAHRENAAERRASRDKKAPPKKPSKAPKVTSDALFKVW